MSTGRLVVATRNAGKLREIQDLLSDLRVQVLGLDAFPHYAAPDETGDTCQDNALIKARAAANRTGLAALADDSALEVEALGGRPGVHTARYGRTDADGIRRLLQELSGVPWPRRRARFVCVIAAVFPDGREVTGEGVLAGHIAERARGDQGFGYDPVFVPLGEERTLAEMTLAEKQRISHRARAVRAVLPHLRAWLREPGAAKG